MFKEFKEFALKGSLVDLAVGFIVGAFGKITPCSSTTSSCRRSACFWAKSISPVCSSTSGGGYATLEAAKAAGAATLNYGAFLSTVVDFLLVALALFFVVKQMKSWAPPAGPAAPAAKSCPFVFPVFRRRPPRWPCPPPIPPLTAARPACSMMSMGMS